MEFSESYTVAVIGGEAATDTLFSRLGAAAKDPSNLHLCTAPAPAPSGDEGEGICVSVGFAPDLSPHAATAFSHLDASPSGGRSGGTPSLSLGSRGTRRVRFDFVTHLSSAPNLIVGVIDSAADAVSVNAARAARGAVSPQSTAKAPQTTALGPSALAVVASAEIAAHEDCPFLIVDLAQPATDAAGGPSAPLDALATPARGGDISGVHPHSPSGAAEVTADNQRRVLSRRLDIILSSAASPSTPSTFAGIVPFAIYETPFDACAEEAEGATPSRSPSTTPKVAASSAPILLDPAAFLSSTYGVLVSPRHVMWDSARECIRPDFVAHFRRCFWLFDKDRDGLLRFTPSEHARSSTSAVGVVDELRAAIAAMFGVCTDEDAREVLATLREAERDMRSGADGGEEGGHCSDEDEEDSFPPLLVFGDDSEAADAEPSTSAEDSATPLPPFAITEAGFVQYLHSLLAAGDHHVRCIWYMLKSAGHSASARGAIHSEGDFAALRRARVRSATEVLHSLDELTDGTVVLDDDEDAPEGADRPRHIVLTSSAVQGQLSPTAVAFFSSLFPSGPRVGHCRPPAFPSLQAMWNVVPPSFVVPWEGVSGLPQPTEWLDRADELVLHRKQGSRSYATYTGRWRLENLFRFLECWEWAASGAVFMPSPPAARAGGQAPTWWRQESLVAFARQWGFRGDASKLFVFRPLRGLREGRPSVDGFPRLVHVCLVGPSGSGKSSLARLITYDGCLDSPFLADDDEHDIPTGDDDGSDGGEVDGSDHASGGDAAASGSVRVSAVTIDSRALAKDAVPGWSAPSGPTDSGLTTIYFYEVPSDQQASMFRTGCEAAGEGAADTYANASQAAASRRHNEKRAAAPTSADALWALMHRPNLLACMDVCLAVFDGSNPLGFSSLMDVWASGGGPSLAKAWTERMRLPIVPVLAKADELPVGQVVEDRHAVPPPARRGRGGSGSSVSSAEARAAGDVASFCAASGLTWPPVMTSSMSEALHPQLAAGHGGPSVVNAADDLNTMVVELAASPSALVGARVSRREREAEAAVERAAVLTRRVIVVAVAIGVVSVVGKVAARLLRGKKASPE